MNYKIFGACDYKKGNYRDNNEDNYYFDDCYAKVDDLNLSDILTVCVENTDCESFGIFDGVGGEANGEKASYLASKCFKKYKESHRVVDNLEYVNMANSVIVGDDSAKNMATTMCLIHFQEDRVVVSNLGDSRIYLLRDGMLKMISTDHTDENIHKKLNVEEKTKPKLMQYLGVDENELSLEPAIKEFDYRSGDRYLLCTDGLTDFVNNSDMENIMKSGKNPRDIVSCLMGMAQDNKTRDNTTIEVFEIKKHNKWIPFIGCGCVVFLMLLLFLFFRISQFKINDQCSSLVENGSCLFQFNAEKYDIEIQDENILEYKNQKLYGIESGSTTVIISKNGKTVYEKDIKVFPNN